MGRSVLIAAVVGLLFLQSAGAVEQPAVTCTITHGPGGPPRTGKLVVCETVFVRQTMTGISHDDAGKIDISIRLEVLDKDGKVVESRPWNRTNQEDSQSTLRTVWAFNLATKPDKDKAGKYVCRLHLHDHIADVKVHADEPFELVSPAGLAAYGLRCGQDPTGQGYAGSAFAIGETIYIHGQFMNFSTENQRVKARMTLNVLDMTGRPKGWKEIAVSGERETSRYEEFARDNFNFKFTAPEVGQFIAAIRIEDGVNGQETTEYIPFLISDLSSLKVPDSLRTASKPVDGAKKR